MPQYIWPWATLADFLRERYDLERLTCSVLHPEYINMTTPDIEWRWREESDVIKLDQSAIAKAIASFVGNVAWIQVEYPRACIIRPKEQEVFANTLVENFLNKGQTFSTLEQAGEFVEASKVWRIKWLALQEFEVQHYDFNGFALTATKDVPRLCEDIVQELKTLPHHSR